MKESNQNSLDQKIDEIYTGHRGVPIHIINKVFKSICKIINKKDKITTYGTGFFMRVSDLLKYIITNYHIINPVIIKNQIEIEIWDKKRIKLTLNNRNIKYFEKPRDITIIEIKKNDEINNYIEFLDYDNNYIKNGYKIYKNIDIFSIEHPFGKDAVCASGSIIDIFNDFEFSHNISTDTGSSGSPIILLNNNPNIIQVIGIHKNRDERLKLNGGTFIGEIFNKINEDNKKINNNFIFAEIYIRDKDVNKDIRIINSHEERVREYKKNKKSDLFKYVLLPFWDTFQKKEYDAFRFRQEIETKIVEEWKNEEEIKETKITINEELIPFNYFYKFKSEGQYLIKYEFSGNLLNLVSLFEDCSSLININLSNFNSENVENIYGMFYGCSSLIHIDFSNFHTKNVKNMAAMFFGCSSLTDINLSNFKTENVENMHGMFSGCSSLTHLNLFNFNTKKVKNMIAIFSGCKSLTSIDLSNFNTENVTDMTAMFENCSSLTYLDLSNFKTKKVIYMKNMFGGCSSLTSLNLSNFNSQNVEDADDMFINCISLKKGNIIINEDNNNNIITHIPQNCILF